MNLIERNVLTLWASLPDYLRSTIWILIVTVAVILSVAFTTLWERKVIGWMQLRSMPASGVAPCCVCSGNSS